MSSEWHSVSCQPVQAEIKDNRCIRHRSLAYDIRSAKAHPVVHVKAFMIG